jgi:galactokinase/mevalonate kinase-like predicted kinase
MPAPAQYLVSLPPGMAPHFAALEGKPPPRWFAGADPPGRPLGSGGGTMHLLLAAWQAEAAGRAQRSFLDWLAAGPRVLVHGGGQSRRLPAYAATGKALAPMPAWRWDVGHRLDQTLLDLQLPFLRALADRASPRQVLTIASGDVLIRAAPQAGPLPDVDVLVLGLWVRPEEARNFGVLFCPRRGKGELAFFLQKPELAQLEALARDHVFLVDTGVWVLSTRAVEVLARKCGVDPAGAAAPASVAPYELYATLGPALGREPAARDPEVAALSSAVLPLPDGEFYHFGTSRDLCRSYARLQNRVLDQRQVSRLYVKPHPEIFQQNTRQGANLGDDNRQIWIENAHLPAGWSLSHDHVITGVPPNDWALTLEPGTCLDFVPVRSGAHAVRGYGIDDAFRGALGDGGTLWFGRSATEWFARRGLTPGDAGLDPRTDLQAARLFPVVELAATGGDGPFIEWLLAATPRRDAGHAARWLGGERLSAEELARDAEMTRLYRQRAALRAEIIPRLHANRARSVFFSLDLGATAATWAETGAALPPRPEGAPAAPMEQVSDHMFRAQVMRRRDQAGWQDEEAQAFRHLAEAIIAPVAAAGARPRLNLLEDQIVWGRSPVRLDLAGGWSDTPPYCLQAGGSVVNVAVDLNGQPPIQVFVKHRPEPEIVMRSIDLGVEETVRSYQAIGDWARVGDAFSIIKAALALCGFHPRFQGGGQRWASLPEQLGAFGGGLELSLVAAVPKGSGLGTSSILAATALGTLGEVCGLDWASYDIVRRTLVLEQMLTTGGGWQDQAGGILPGIKLVETEPSLEQVPTTRWLPDTLLAAPHANATVLLYYTGITRVAKGILQEIVRGMFLNGRDHLEVLRQIAQHAHQTCDVIQRADGDGLSRAVARSWILNQRLDAGTNPPEVAAILDRVSDWLAGAKLLGAGGGGYMLMFAKDLDAAQRLRAELTTRPPNPRARFVTFAVSSTGLQITRS